MPESRFLIEWKADAGCWKRKSKQYDADQKRGSSSLFLNGPKQGDARWKIIQLSKTNAKTQLELRPRFIYVFLTASWEIVFSFFWNKNAFCCRSELIGSRYYQFGETLREGKFTLQVSIPVKKLITFRTFWRQLSWDFLAEFLCRCVNFR